MGGEFTATGQFYEEGEEDAPLLSRSAEADATGLENGAATVAIDCEDPEEAR